MTFQDQLDLDLDRVEFRDYGESVTWTPAGGSATSCTAIVVRDDAEPEDNEDGQEIARWATVVFQTSEASAIARNDVVSFPKQAGGTAANWNVMSEPVNHGDGVIRVRCYRREPVEMSAEGHRKEL